MITIEDLNQFVGTSKYHLDYLGLKLTDGTAFIRDELKAGWLISDIASVWKCEAKVKDKGFIVITLEIRNAKKEATLIFSEDKDGEKYIKVLYKQQYKFTDIAEYYDGTEIKFYLIDGVLLLPSEY